jgi:CIC family chloride channel protein
VSLFVASRLQKEPIYEALAIQDGIHLPSAEGRVRHGQRQVAKVMHGAGESLPADTPVREALARVRSSGIRTWLVTDQRGVIGVVSLINLEEALQGNNGAEKQVGDLVNAVVFPHVHPDQALDLALERMGTNQLDILPVVNRGDVHKLEGVVTLRDVLDAYGVGRA